MCGTRESVAERLGQHLGLFPNLLPTSLSPHLSTHTWRWAKIRSSSCQKQATYARRYAFSCPHAVSFRTISSMNLTSFLRRRDRTMDRGSSIMQTRSKGCGMIRPFAGNGLVAVVLSSRHLRQTLDETRARQRFKVQMST